MHGLQDGTRLAFTAALDGDSTDIYLFNLSDSSVTRLTDEAGDAAADALVAGWSISSIYRSVISFGTGAGVAMEGLWVYDFETSQASTVEDIGK